MYIVYTTDKHHTTKSKLKAGIFTDRKIAINSIGIYLSEQKTDLDLISTAMNQLTEIDQTQCLENYEFIIEAMDNVNELDL